MTARRTIGHALSFLVLACILAAPTMQITAAEMPVRLPPDAPAAKGDAGQVTGIIDGDTLVLDNGEQVRLVGIQAPKLPLGRPGFKAWPLAPEARDTLSALTLSRRIMLHFGGRRKDRYRRHLAHLGLGDGTWVQGSLLAAGLARVYSFRDNRALIADMLALERQARQARRGIWALPHYRIRNPAEAHGDIDSFQIVEGRVVKATKVRETVYLNFGQDWRTDFTFMIGRRALRLFGKAGREPLDLTGRRVRGRGWIRPRNGPLIEITHPEQLEIVAE